MLEMLRCGKFIEILDIRSFLKLGEKKHVTKWEVVQQAMFDCRRVIVVITENVSAP